MHTIGIRVDANEKIAMGHLMRCMSVALQLKKAEQAVIFILSENYAEKLVRQNGFACICLSRIYVQKELELNELKSLILEKKMDVLLVDAYDISFRYVQELRPVCKIAYMDDLGRFAYPADLIINYSYGIEVPQEEIQKDRHKKFLTGIRYAPLREEFSGEGITVRDTVERIFMTTGGTDPFGMAAAVLRAMKRFKNMEKHVVAGKFCQNVQTLQGMAQADALIQIYHDIPDIYRVMKKCDLAVSAGGSTQAELCACGIPTISFTMADNQLYGTRAYAQAGMILYAGDVREDREAVVGRIVEDIEMLSRNAAKRKEMGTAGKEIVDGKGACRIAEEVIRLAEEAGIRR